MSVPATQKYVPTIPKVGEKMDEAFLVWLSDELTRISVAITDNQFGRDVMTVEPIRKYQGMIVFADGVSWDPDNLGLGEGVYAYTLGSGWVPLF